MTWEYDIRVKLLVFIFQHFIIDKIEIPVMLLTVSYDEIKQKVITQANNYHRVKAYTP